MPLTDLPNTRVRHSHGLSIVVQGTNVGSVHRFDDRIARNHDMTFAFGPLVGSFQSSSANPFDIVPGNISSQEIQMERWDLFTAVWEAIFGTLGNMNTLNQNRAASLRATTLQPDPVVGGASSSADVESFEGAWMQDMGRPLSADGERRINVSGSWMYTYRTTLQGVTV